MEGIFDSAARDDCFFCALLYPVEHADDCPRCRKQMRLQPPVRIDAPTLEQAIGELADGFVEAPSLESLELLLTELHRFHPTALEALVATSAFDLDELRRQWRELSVSSSG